MRDERLNLLFTPITRLKGVGGGTAKALARLLPAATQITSAGFPIIRDLLFHLPVGVVDRRFTCPLASAPDGVVASFVVKIIAHQPPPAAGRRFGKKPYKVICGNETGDISLVFFNAHEDYLKQALPLGQMRVISGRVERFDHRLQMTHPDIVTTVDRLAEVQKLEPIYPLTAGLSSRRIAKMVADVLQKLPDLPEWILPETMQKNGWANWRQTFAATHNPQSQEDILATSPARLRLAYDEMLAGQLHLAMLRRNRDKQAANIITGNGNLCEQLIKSLPYQLTGGQQNVLQEIYADMASGKRMGRLLQGDVGSGKTVVALLAMLRAIEAGFQCALMVPTEIIARQHFEVISSLLSLLPPTPLRGREICVTLLTGSVKGAQRKSALAEIASGRANIVIGTHALFQEGVEFANLSLIVIDEQHRFGVNQRMALSAKGDAPHILHMTATPIPRSLTMTLYGDMDSSLLTEKPAQRQPITTRVIPLSRYAEIMERLQAALDRGEKVYWICPLVDDGEKELLTDDIAAATKRHTEFQDRFGEVVGLVHGQMKSDMRDAAMHDFASGKTRLLVATTVVEVGVDVRDATIIVIEKAERFGLAQLHQLRGRVGRGDKASSCVLLYSDNLSEAGKARLSILRETEDGFRIAEADLAIRGGGELLGTRQSGLPRFIFTNLAEHQELLEEARADAAHTLETDPMLESLRGKALAILLQLFGFA